MKTLTEFKTDLKTLRTDLNATTYRVEKVQELLSDLVEKLDGLYDQSVSNKDQAVNLVRTADTLKIPSKDRQLCSSHYRMLAILSVYGVMEREHIAKILGIKPKTVSQYAHIVKHNGLAQLRSRKGTLILDSLADEVRDNENFRI